MLAVVTPALAEPQGVGNGDTIKSLSDSSDAIVVGTVAGVPADGVFDLNVARVLKGAVDSVILRVTGPTAAATQPQPPANTPGIFFLSHGMGAWNLLPILGGSAPFDETYLPARLEAPSTVDTDPLERVIAEFDAALDETTILRYRFDLTSISGTTTSARLTALYRRLASSSSPVLASAGLAGLISLNDPSALQKCEAAARMLGDPRAFLEDLAAAIRQVYRNPDPAGTAALARIASDSAMDVGLRRAAAFSLRAIHTSSTVCSTPMNSNTFSFGCGGGPRTRPHSRTESGFGSIAARRSAT